MPLCVTNCFRKKVEQLKKQNDSITDCTLLLKDLLQHWLENEVIGRVKQSSYQTYVRQINVHLLPKLGSLTLSEISSSVIYQFVAQLEASSMAYNSIKSVVRLLNAPLRYAQKMGYISQNPCRKIKIQPKEIIEQRVLSRLEQDKLRKQSVSQNDLPTLGTFLGIGLQCLIVRAETYKQKRRNTHESRCCS